MATSKNFSVDFHRSPTPQWRKEIVFGCRFCGKKSNMSGYKKEFSQLSKLVEHIYQCHPKEFKGLDPFYQDFMLPISDRIAVREDRYGPFVPEEDPYAWKRNQGKKGKAKLPNKQYKGMEF